MLRRARTILIMVLCVSFVVQPCAFAFADDYGGSDGGDFSYKVVYGPSAPTIGSTTKQVQVYAPNNFEAALIVLGYGNDSRVTDDVKAYLSNQSTGGTFYDFAQGFTNNNTSWGNPLMFQDLGMSSALSMNNSLYGAENVWSSEYDMTMYEGARQRVMEVLNGNVGGGSGGGGGDNSGAYEGDYVAPDQLRFTMDNYVGNDAGKNYSEWYVSPRPDPYKFPLAVEVVVNLPDTVKQRMQSTGSTYKYATFMLWRNDGIYENQSTTLQIYMSVNQPILDNGVSLTINGKYWSMQCDTDKITNNGLNTLGLSRITNPSVTNSDTSTFTFTFGNRAVFVIGAGAGSSTPTVPPTNWPENPTVTPTVPPEVPEPTSPTIPTQPPEPVNPISPTYPTIVYEPDVTYVTADLSAVLNALNAHCKHLQDALHRECSNLWTNVSTLVSNQFSTTRNFMHTQFDWLIDSIDEEFDDFELYLKTLFEWLANQMSYTFTDSGYDDNTVVSWLKKIYYKLGMGTTTRPVDPTVDPIGTWDWLTRLFADLMANLVMIGQDELAEVMGMLNQLIHKFPFSVPWDIAALLGLLVAPPVAPEIQVPQMALTGSGLSQVGTYDISLQDYNDAWEGVRFIEKVGFAVFLAWHTTHFLDVFRKGGAKE